MRKKMVIGLVSIMAIGVVAVAQGSNDVFPVDREMYPYYPSLLKWNKSPAPFNPPEVCGECHEKQYEEWTGSVHALAFKDPVYQGELNKAVKRWGTRLAGSARDVIRLSGLSPVK